MTSTVMKKVGLGAAALCGSLALTMGEALAATPVPDKGDTAWMLVSTILVLLMIVPGLALFYGGLVRSKNMLSVLMQTLVVASIVMLVWCLWGYSMAFTSGGALDKYVGGFSKMFLAGVDPSTVVETFSRGVVIPEGLVVGQDPEEDAKWFRRSENGIVLITQEMLNARAAKLG